MSTTPRTLLVAGMLIGGMALSVPLGERLEAQPQSRVFRIGLVTALSGWSSAFAGEVRAGAQLAVDEVNLAGGVAGRRLELVVKDDWTSLDASIKGFNELATQGVRVILGPDTTEGALATMPLAMKRNVLQILPSAQTLDEQGHADDNTIFLFPPIRAESQATARYAAERFKARRVAIINPADPYGEARSRALTEALRKLQIEVAADVRFEKVQGDFTPLFRKILESKPDVVVFPAFLFERSAFLVQHARRAGIKVPLIGEGAACALMLDILLREDPIDQQVFFINESFSQEFTNNRVMQNFIAAYEPRAYVANPIAASGHAAVMLVRDAIAKGAITAPTMKRAILGAKAVTAFGQMAFDRNGDNIVYDYSLFQLNPEANLLSGAAVAQKIPQMRLVR